MNLFPISDHFDSDRFPHRSFGNDPWNVFGRLYLFPIKVKEDVPSLDPFHVGRPFWDQLCDQSSPGLIYSGSLGDIGNDALNECSNPFPNDFPFSLPSSIISKVCEDTMEGHHGAQADTEAVRDIFFL